jgi:hypothetical protein
MAMKHFNGDTQLIAISTMNNKEFAVKFPGVKGKRVDSFSMMVGVAAGAAWRDAVPVERSVFYKSNPSKHQCDARCMFAKGRTMNCECSCGGKNHGIGSFTCN